VTSVRSELFWEEALEFASAVARRTTSGQPRILARIFRANKKEFIKTVHDPKIAAAVSPQNIADRSPTFRRFISVLSEGPV
jgi:hypothetical protein